jgi:putative acyl-CoA dehydrogenase
VAREPGCVLALLDELRQARGADRDYDRFVDALDAELTDLGRHEGQARRLVERLALGLSAGLLLRHAPEVIAGAFIKARLAGPWAGHFGDLPLGLEVDTMARRAVPNLV